MTSDIDTTIVGYEDSFQALKKALLEGAAVQQGITVVRIMNVMEYTGMSDVSRPLVKRSLT